MCYIDLMGVLRLGTDHCCGVDRVIHGASQLGYPEESCESIVEQLHILLRRLWLLSYLTPKRRFETWQGHGGQLCLGRHLNFHKR